MKPADELQEAARRMRDDPDARWQAVAHGLAHEAVLAQEADHLASVASSTVMWNVAPAYRPATTYALDVARAYLRSGGP